MSHAALPCQRRIVETRRDPRRATHYLHLLDCGHIVSRQASLTRRQAQCGHCMAATSEEDDRRAIWERWRPEPVKLRVVG